MVTPAAISSSFLLCLTICLTSASSVWLLIPRTSSGFSTQNGLDPQSASPVDRHESREIDLAEGAGSRNLPEGVEEGGEGEGVDPAVDLSQLALRLRCVAFLDDAAEPAVLSNDAAVAVWAGQRGGQHGEGGVRPLVGLDQSP